MTGSASVVPTISLAIRIFRYVWTELHRDFEFLHQESVEGSLHKFHSRRHRTPVSSGGVDLVVKKKSPYVLR